MSVERAAREKIGRAGSIHERHKHVLEVVIDDLSTTGCFVRGRFAIEVGSILSIGVPGIGMHAARVMRLADDGAGCAFLLPLDAADVEIARTAEAVSNVDVGEVARGGGFIQMKEAVRSAASIEGARPVAETGPLKARFSRAMSALRISR